MDPPKLSRDGGISLLLTSGCVIFMRYASNLTPC